MTVAPPAVRLVPAPAGEQDPSAGAPAALARVLADGTLRSVFQPVVDLATGRTTAFEALVRGPEGPLATPDALFAAARAAGRLAELDRACRSTALRSAVRAGVVDPLTLFVNVEPEVLDAAPLEELLEVAGGAHGDLRVVVEITERALAARPADLLRTVARVREAGWSLALDDVGADATSLAFMPLLRPDVVKLDLRLVQDRPGPAVAEIVTAVGAYAQESGALVLAEGIETERHLRMAVAMGASLGQGWYFGRPTATPDVTGTGRGPRLRLPASDPVPAADAAASPFALLPAGTELRRSPKALLIEVSKHLERSALRIGSTGVVAATFQEARHFTPATAGRYRDLAERVGFVAAFGEGMPDDPLPGVRGAALAPGDPVRGEWDVVVLGPHFAAALLARDLGDDGPDAERTFEHVLTYDRATVVAAARSLLSRVVPRPPGRAADAPVRSGEAPALPAALADLALDDAVLRRALEASGSGICVADVTAPDHPLVYVNRAFERLAGRSAAQVLGRNCRFLQGGDTDPATVAAVRAAIGAGRPWRGVLLNHRGPERTPWWNEVHLAPVPDVTGRVVQYVGVQVDVTERVLAQQALEVERDRARRYAGEVERLAATDPLTGLPNRRHLYDRLGAALADGAGDDGGVALLFCDLDGFKAVNDRFGHQAGDDLLVQVSHRLRAVLRRDDVLVRLGGDEFIVALTGLDAAGQPLAGRAATHVAAALADRIGQPFDLDVEGAVRQVRVGLSVGVAVAAAGDDVEGLLRSADTAMYEAKELGRQLRPREVDRRV